MEGINGDQLDFLTGTLALNRFSSFFHARWPRAWLLLTHPSQPAVVGYIACIILISIWWRWWCYLDVNTYYYAFSTIAQTLAGAFGFLVAVALFRIQNIESEMERAVAEVIPYAASADDQGLLQMKTRSHEWGDMDGYINQQLIDALPGDGLKSAVSTNWNVSN